MSRLLSSTAIALALTFPVASPVWAQTSTDGAMTDPNRLIGQEVQTRGGETLGEIESVIRGQDNQVAGIVVNPAASFGGYDGNIALDWDDVTVDSQGQAVVANIDREQLQGLPQAGAMGATSGMENGEVPDISESQPGVVTGEDVEKREDAPAAGQGGGMD